MAMQALYEYASKDTNRDLYNLKVTVEATSTPSWSRVFSMTKENWGILQTVDVSRRIRPRQFDDLINWTDSNFCKINFFFSQVIKLLWSNAEIFFLFGGGVGV